MANIARLGLKFDASDAKRGAAQARDALTSLSGTARRTEATMVQAARAIAGSFAVIGTAFGAREVLAVADSWTRLEGRLRTVTGSTRELESVQRQLGAVANTTRTSLEETAGLYTRLARTANDLGLSQSDIIRLTELTAKTLTVSGTSAAQAGGALLQLSQALGGGIVRAEEFNSILEGTPVIAQEVARSMGLTVAQLRTLVTEGGVTSQAFARAFLDAGARIDASFSQLGPTVEGALTQLSNAFTEAIGRANTASGTTEELARAIGDLAQLIRDNQDTFDAMGEVFAWITRRLSEGAKAFVEAGTAVDELGRYIDGTAEAVKGLATFDPSAWVDGMRRMDDANSRWADTMQRIKGIFADGQLREDLQSSPTLSPAGQSYLQGLQGGPQLTAAPFGMFGAFPTSATPATPPRVPPAVPGAAADEVKRAAAEQKKWAEETRKAEATLRAITGILDTANARTATVFSQWVDAQDALDADRKAVKDATAQRAAAAREILDRQAHEISLLGKTAEQKRQLIDLERYRLALAQGMTDAQAEEYVRNARVLDEANRQAESWTTHLRDALGVVQLIGQAFGEVGRTVSQVATGAQSIVTGLARAGSITDSAGNKVGLGGALSGKAGASGVVAGLGAAGAVVGGIAQVANALDLFGTRARERARQMAEAAAAFNQALDDFALTDRTSLDDALRQNLRSANALVAQAAAASGGTARGVNIQSVGDLDAMIASFQGIAAQVPAAAKAVGPFVARLEELRAVILDNERALIARNAAEVARLQEDLEVRRLRAASMDGEAERLAAQLSAQRELDAAIARYGQDSPYIAALRAVQTEEAAAAEATKARLEVERTARENRARNDLGFDLAARRQTLNGDTRGAFVTRQNAGASKALQEAQDLFDAGTITAEMFAELTRIINDELTQAIRDFDQAAAEAAAQAQAAAAAAEQERLAGIQQAQTAIIKEMIEAYKVLDPQLAQSLEQQQKTIDRNERLANTTDDVTRAQLEHLFALQDEAEAQMAAAQAAEAAARAFERQAEAARKFAEVGLDAEERYLRATGKTFEADAKRRKRERDEQLADAAKAFGALGLPINPNSPNFIQQIQAWGAKQAEWQQIVDNINGAYDADMAALIAAQMNGSATPGTSGAGGASGGSSWNPGRPADIPILGGDSVTMRSAASMTETSATRLIDFASAQLSVQRRILQILEGKQAAGRDELLGPAFSPQTIRQIDRGLGNLAADSALLIGGRVL